MIFLKGLSLLTEFKDDKVTCVAVKHGAPCGVAVGQTARIFSLQDGLLNNKDKNF